jgi:hypothetical protein
MNKIKIVKTLILLSFLSLIFINPYAAKAVQDPVGSPTLAWTNTNSNCEIWDDTVKVFGDFVYLSCFDTNTVGGDGQIRIEKRDKLTGDLVSGFGVAGVVTENPSTNEDWVYAFEVNSSGIYIGDTDFTPGGSNSQWRIEKRDIDTGELVTNFGTNGVIIENISSGQDSPRTMTSDNDYLYIGGFDNTAGNYSWRFEKRNLVTGSLISNFGISGAVTEYIGGNQEWPNSMTVSNSGLFIVGFDSTPGSTQWRIEKRSLSDGSLVTEFGNNGIISENISDSGDAAASITILNEKLLIGGGDSDPGDFQWRLEKRDSVTGALESEFGNNGVININSSDYYDLLCAMEVNETGVYLAGYDYFLGETDGRWVVEKRNFTTGALDPNFGSNGSYVINITEEYEELYSIALDETGIYLGGSSYNMEWTYHAGVLQKYSFPEDSTPPTFSNLPDSNSPINLTEGQSITTNPYVISVKPADNIEVARVEFYVDDTKICTDTSADSDGIYSCSWDTSLYHSDIRVVAYDTTGNPSTPLTRSINVDPALYATELPNTGMPIYLYSLLFLPIAFVTMRKLKTR